jgi:hypothetical protein
VLDVKELNEKFRKKFASLAEQKVARTSSDMERLQKLAVMKTWTSAQFALQMSEGVQMVRFVKTA